MTVPAWDLDAPTDGPGAAPGRRLGPALPLAVALACLGLGGLIGSVLTPAAAPRFPPTASLRIRDLYVDTSAEAPAADPSADAGADAGAAPADGSRTRLGAAVVVLRLQIDNPGPEPVRFTRLMLDGVARTPSDLALDVRVAGHRAAAMDLTVRPDCSPGREPAALRATLRPDRSIGTPRDAVPVAPSRALTRTGGLCSELDSSLPRGWRTPLQANSTRLQGQDLEVTIDDLSGEQLAGILVGDRLLPTVFVGDQLLNTSARLTPGAETHLLLQGPPPCIQFSGSTPIPSTLRLLTRGDQGIQQRLVVVGPALTRWLRLDCDR